MILNKILSVVKIVGEDLHDRLITPRIFTLKPNKIII